MYTTTDYHVSHISGLCITGQHYEWFTTSRVTLVEAVGTAYPATIIRTGYTHVDATMVGWEPGREHDVYPNGYYVILEDDHYGAGYGADDVSGARNQGPVVRSCWRWNGCPGRIRVCVTSRKSQGLQVPIRW